VASFDNGEWFTQLTEQGSPLLMREDYKQVVGHQGGTHIKGFWPQSTNKDQVHSKPEEEEFAESEVIKDYTERDYRTVWQKPRAKFENRFEGQIIAQMMPAKLGWFIDLGGGYGRLYPQYAREGRKVVLVDYATNLLHMAEKEYGSKKDIFFIAANAYHLPFKDEVFDAGTTIRTFHHMNLPEKFFQELARVFRPKSEVLFEYSNKRNILRIFKRGRRSLRKDHEEYSEWQFGTHPAYVKNTANEVGFGVEKTMGTAFFPRYLTEKTLFLEPILGVVETIFDLTLGRIGLAPMNFARLCKRSAAEITETPGSKLSDILKCPACRGDVQEINEGFRCISCARLFPKNGQVIDFRFTAD
jgi:ubiquinone/menaquinone biosynthesis C-methylase UbiE